MSTQLYIATRKGLFVAERQINGWGVRSAAFLGDPVTLVLNDTRTPGLVYAALRHGHFGVKVHRSTDGGRTFTECAAPAYPKDEDETTGGDQAKGDDEAKARSVDTIWSLVAGGADQPDRLWAGTIPGGLFRSDDGGESWILNGALDAVPERSAWFGGGADEPGVHSVLVDPRDSRSLTTAVSIGGVWHSDDDGAGWRLRGQGMRAEYMPPEKAGDPAIQDPHAIVQCPSAPDALWCQHHNGIFKSTDRGATWTEIERAGPSTFGFAVAVHPSDPDTAWFVPAEKDERRIPVGGKVVVTRTRDGGRTFDVLREGLPQTFAYDLTFRHALDVDDSGEVLAFGTTTGSVFVSEDGGDSWSAISRHLPPVYAVRF